MTESSALFKFSTDDYPDEDKASVWRDHFGDALVKMDMTAFGDEPFRSVSHIRTLPDLNIWWCSITESEVRRTSAHVADADDSLVFAIVAKGRTAITQAGREVVFGQGDALLWSAERMGIYRNLSAAEMICLKFSRRSLAATVADLDKTLMNAIPSSNEALGLLTNYVEILYADPAPMAPELLALGVPHIHDLVSLALGATRDAAESAKTGGLRAARLLAIKADIVANLADPGLAVDTIAARHAISPRYIRALFDSEHTTFTDFVREQRLRRAYRILSDQASIGRSIGMVALDCGYASISYFNQAFRRRYGATPTDIRNSAGEETALSDFRFSTRDYRGADSIAAWREIFGQKIANLDMEPPGDQPFQGEAFVRALPDLTIGLIESSPNRITRTKALIGDGNDDVMLGIMLKGRAVIFQQNYGEVTVGCGDAVVWSNSSPGYSHYTESIEFLSIAIPRSALLPHLLHPDNAAPAVISANNKVLRLLALYVQAMQRTSMPQGLQSVAAMHVRDLVATVLGPTADAAHLAARRGVSDARLRAIKVDIAANITRSDLTIGAVAARHGLSPRSISMLFNREGTTFSDFVLEQRLAQVHRLLIDPLFAARTISSIALESGFGDISYFNNAFRRRYAATPSDVRDAAKSSE